MLHIRWRHRVEVLLLLVLAHAGCVAAGQQTGPVIDRDSVREVKAGIPADQMRRMLGEPSRTQLEDAGRQTWTYVYTRQRYWDTGPNLCPLCYFVPQPPSGDRLQRIVEITVHDGVVTGCSFHERYSAKAPYEPGPYTTEPCSR